MTEVTWIQNFGYSADGYYRIERWGGSKVGGFFFALSTPEINYMTLKGPFSTRERRDEAIQQEISKHDATAYNGA